MTEQQERFLDALFSEEAQGDFRKAMDIAGYSKTTSTTVVREALKEQIAEKTRTFLSGPAATKAAYVIYQSLDPKSSFKDLAGLRERITAAKDILSRGGYSESTTVKVENESPLFILPPKDSDETDEEV